MKEAIENKIKEIIESDFKVYDIANVPVPEDRRLTCGRRGLRFEATVLFFTMRDWTSLLYHHDKTTVAKLQMSYFQTIVTIVEHLGGEIRNFNGNSMFIFFQGTTKESLNNAVKAAMQIKYMFTADDANVKRTLESYSTLDFGIGIDDGEILCTRIGIFGSPNQDLVWIGTAINKAMKIADQLSAPDHIGISSYVYKNLTDDVKYIVKKNFLGYNQNINIWKPSSFSYNGKYTLYRHTSHCWRIS